MKKLPFDGVRVLDLTMMWAGPVATKIMAEMGAEVLKIESPSAWDNIRTLIPQQDVDDPWNSSYYFNYYNRDKKSVTLDLANARGRDLLLELVPHCDIVIENYRADVLDKLGLGYETLRARREDIILISMAGYGKTGADRDSVGFGPIIEQMSGLASLSGYHDDETPYKTGISYGDPIAGIAAVGAAALALIRRRKHGQGASIDLAQRETLSAFIGESFVAASLRGEAPARSGNRHPSFAPQGVYPCAGDEQWIALSVRDDNEWRALCDLIEADDLADLNADQRREQHDDLDARITDWTRDQEPQTVMEELQGAGIPAGRVLDTAAIHDDPQLNALGFWTALPHPRMHEWLQPESPWRLVEANPRLRRHAPLFGEHNAEILGGLLGLSAEDLAALEADGIIGDRPINPGVG